MNTNASESMDDWDNLALTATQQMQHIRRMVNAAGSDGEALALLNQHFSRSEAMLGQLSSLERAGRVTEQPFTSSAPVIGKLIVLMRATWNWMSTRWYVLPLIQQQNRYNTLNVQLLRELITSQETALALIREMAAARNNEHRN